MRRSLLWLTLAVVLLAGFGVANIERWLGGVPLDLQQPQAVLVKPGDTLTSLAHRLDEAGLISHPWQLLGLARLEDGGHRILAGEYQLFPGQTLAELLVALRNGNTINEKVTIIEGETFATMLAKIQAAPGITVTTSGLDANQVMQRLGHRELPAEGNFFPDTYFYSAGITDLTLLEGIFQAMQSQLDHLWQQRVEPLAIDSPQQALILASIIEKESGRQSEGRRISGVFHRRLEQGVRLQADSTIIYGLGDEFDGDIRRRDLRRDTPYNSYLHNGLPPTAIALPGLVSLQAAVNPDRDDQSLYFVARGDGSHQFSATLKAHNRAVRRYQLGIK